MGKLICLGALAGSLALLAGLVAGCGKKGDSGAAAAGSGAAQPAAAQPDPGSASASNIAGAKEIMAALDKNDFDGAMAGVMRAAQGVSNAEQRRQFAVLADEVRIKLLEAGPANPKVSEALSVLRGLTGGR